MLRIRVLLEKLPVTYLVKKFLALYGTENASLYSQEPATALYPELVESISHLPIRFP